MSVQEIDTYPLDCAYWIGTLSMSMALATTAIKQDRRRDAQRHMKRTLDEFLRSPVPSEELRDHLREEMK